MRGYQTHGWAKSGMSKSYHVVTVNPHGMVKWFINKRMSWYGAALETNIAQNVYIFFYDKEKNIVAERIAFSVNR